MFKRVIFDEFDERIVLVIVIVSFALVATVFLIGVIRAFSMPKEQRDHLASLPLEGESDPPAPNQDPTPPLTKQ